MTNELLKNMAEVPNGMSLGFESSIIPEGFVLAVHDNSTGLTKRMGPSPSSSIPDLMVLEPFYTDFVGIIENAQNLRPSVRNWEAAFITFDRVSNGQKKICVKRAGEGEYVSDMVGKGACSSPFDGAFFFISEDGMSLLLTYYYNGEFDPTVSLVANLGREAEYISSVSSEGFNEPLRLVIIYKDKTVGVFSFPQV